MWYTADFPPTCTLLFVYNNRKFGESEEGKQVWLENLRNVGENFTMSVVLMATFP